MSRTLYTSWFSPFARKVALALELKQLPYEAVDALTREFRPRLLEANSRAEVPVLIDDGVVIVNSSDILQYLDWQYPSSPLYPQRSKERVLVRTLERLADHRFDPIIVDCSFWQWAERDDAPPPGLREAGQRDLEATLAILEKHLLQLPKPWPFGSPGVVECSWYPNLLAARPLGFAIDEGKYRTVMTWLAAMREHPVFAADRKRAAQFMKTLSSSTHERRRLFWSGDRLEWLLSRGFYDWFADEIKADRVAFPE